MPVANRPNSGQMLSPVRPNVLRMRPYSPGKPIEEVRREFNVHPIIKLASNENPWGPSPLALEAVRRAAETMHLYPDGSVYDLKERLAAHFEVPAKNIVCGSGSDELIHLIGLVLLGSPDDEVLVGDPSFVRYDAAAFLAPCKLVKVPLDADHRHDLKAMRAAITDRTKLVFIANPNNPTGTTVQRREMAAFVADLPDHTTLVLDEAYFEFGAAFDAEYPSSLEFLGTERVVGLRTFSKAYGLAGIRLGYGFFPGWLADAFERARAPFNVNSLAQAAGIAALGDTAHLERTISGTRRSLDRLATAFREAGFAPVESAANFVFADLGRPGRPLFQSLLERGVIVRPGDVLGAPNAIRVSVGTDEEMDVFEEEFRTVLKTAAVA